MKAEGKKLIEYPMNQSDIYSIKHSNELDLLYVCGYGTIINCIDVTTLETKGKLRLFIKCVPNEDQVFFKSKLFLATKPSTRVWGS